MFVSQARAVDGDEDKVGFTADIVMRLAVDHPAVDDVQSPVVINDHGANQDLAESA
jgi:hypothetical protein